MKVEKLSGKEERRVLMGMIVNRHVLGHVAAKWTEDNEMFRSKWANIVGELAVRYFRKYEKAPKKSIEPMFEAWATTRKRDPETISLVERFLGNLSAEYETLGEINPPHLVDMAGAHFTRVKLERLRDHIDGHIDLGQVDQAEKAVRDFKSVKLGAGGYVDVLADTAALESAFASIEEPLLTLSDGLGGFFGNSLKRGAFVSFLAPEKVGKTTELVDMTWRAMMQRLRVAFFSLGDESQDEMMLRFAQRASRRPAYADVLKFPTAVRMHEGQFQARYETHEFTSGLTAKYARETFQRIAAERLRSDESYLRLVTVAAGELSPQGISDQLTEWERDGWVADVVVGDYMENLDELGNPRDEPRHRISATWRGMRGVAMNHHALVLTATQANTAANTVDFLTRANFSESKTKLAHVTGMVGINQNEQEKARGILRLNWVVRRGAFFQSARQCHCVGSFGVQSPAMRSLY